MPVLRADGLDVVRLVRRPASSADERGWDPDRGSLDPAHLAGADAVVNLAGANIGSRRWSTRFKERLRSSRVNPTATLARAIVELPATDRPRVMINASGIDYYGDTGDRPVTEDSPAGEGFLAEMCRIWEAATAPAERAGVRVVHLRTGFPLAVDGGLLKPMLIQFHLFAGGRMGTGRQFIPWISIVDWVGAVSFLRDHEVAGPVNVCGPDPVRNAEFARTLGRVLHRPSFWPIPGIAFRIALGEFGSEALASRRALPGALTRAGYPFQHRDLESALRHR